MKISAINGAFLSVFLAVTLLMPAEGAIPPVDKMVNPDEKGTVEQAVALARAGVLGFTLPEGWTYTYDPRYGACGHLFGAGSGCTPIADDEPFVASDKYEPVWALTSLYQNSTLFFKTSATGNESFSVAYHDPEGDENTIVYVAPQPFTHLEMAVYVLGHEVHGHLVTQMNGFTDDEMTANYYGLKAVKTLRALH